jgi:chromosomal replication initiator protein
MERIITDEISAINEVLAENVGLQKYQIWFKNSTRFTLADGCIKIGVPNLFIAGWLESHFADEISHAAQNVTGKKQKLTFVIDPELTGHHRCTHLDSPIRSAEKTKNRVISRTVRQEPATGRKLRLSLDTFIVGRSNELAYTAAKAVAGENQSSFNPLFVHGGYGVGKTHLLQGICNAVCKNRPETNWLYLSAEDFANQFILALKTKKLEAFRRRMRQTDLLAIDDVHFLASKPSTQEEFLHTFNAINLAGKQVVLASDSHPKMINQLSEKLVNRFVSGMVVKIDPPDFQTRCQICKQYAEAMGKSIPEPVIRYTAEHLRNNVRELEGALLKLIALSSLQNEKINLTMAQAVLAEHLARTDPIVHISDIEAAVAAYFGTSTADIHSSKKDNTIAMARHFSMYLARKHTKMSSPEVGRFLGNKNHATVLLACKKIEEQIGRNAELHWHGPAGNKVSTAKIVLAALEESISS